MTQPAVSVNMPAFNAGAFLEPAVRSILAQTFTNFELLVIDDGSTDDSVERIAAIADARIRILRNARNLGIVASRNRAIAESRAPLIAILDSDDLAHPERLARQILPARKAHGPRQAVGDLVHTHDHRSDRHANHRQPRQRRKSHHRPRRARDDKRENRSPNAHAAQPRSRGVDVQVRVALLAHGPVAHSVR